MADEEDKRSTSAIQRRRRFRVANAHFDFGRALPSVGYYTNDDSDLYTTNDVAGDPTAYAGDLLFSVGCHAGLDIDTAEVAQSDIGQTADWATTFAQAGAVWVANTGYGYMDSNTVAYSVALMTDFSADLGQPVSIGQAGRGRAAVRRGQHVAQLVRAQIHDGFDLTACPCARSTRAPRRAVRYPLPTRSTVLHRAHQHSCPVSLPYTGQQGQPDPTNGDLSEQSGTNGANYFQVNGASDPTTSVEYRPIEPQTSVNVTEPGNVAHGALITALTSTDLTAFTPTVSEPEAADVITSAASSSAFRAPSKDWPLKRTSRSRAWPRRCISTSSPDSTWPVRPRRRGHSEAVHQHRRPVFYTSPDSLLADDFTPSTVQSSSAITTSGTSPFRLAPARANLAGGCPRRRSPRLVRPGPHRFGHPGHLDVSGTESEQRLLDGQ